MTSNVLPQSAVLALTLLYCVGCDGRASAGPPLDRAPLLSPPGPPASASETTSDAATAAPARESPPADCPPPVRLPPRVLAAEWPDRLAQRVRLACRVVRAVGVAEYLVTADGVYFIAVAEPGSPPCRPSTSTFIITGAARVHDHGRTSLPELLVDTCGQ